MSDFVAGFFVFCVILAVNWYNQSMQNKRNQPKAEPEKKEPARHQAGENAQYLLTETGERYRVSELSAERTLVERVNNRGKQLSAEAVDEGLDEVIDRLLKIVTPPDFVPQRRTMAVRKQRLLPKNKANLMLPAPRAVSH